MKVLVPIANGSEEIESVCLIDTLRRGGLEVTVASVEEDMTVTCARKTKITTDLPILRCVNTVWDLVVLPGGMPGAERLRDSEPLREILLKQKEGNRFYGAICASPAVVLQHHGLLAGKQATCFPSERFVALLPNKEKVDDRVVIDGKCATSRGPGTAIEFALALIEILVSKEKAEEVQKAMLVL